MMLDTANNDEGPGGEGSRLLSSASASAYDSLSIFNDLTYSDDEDETDLWAADYSSPDTAALVEEILSNAMFSPAAGGESDADADADAEAAAATTVARRRQQSRLQSHEEEQRRASSHLMHPLASQGQQPPTPGGSYHESGSWLSEADEGSTLAYSISSTAVGDDEEAASSGRGSSLSTTPTGLGYYGTSPTSSFEGVIRPKGAVGIFRPPSPVHERSPPTHAQYAQQYFYQPGFQQREREREREQRRQSPATSSSSPRTTTLKPKRSREFLVHQHPSTRNNNYPAGMVGRHHSSSPESVVGGNNDNGGGITKNGNKFQHPHPLVITPLPFRGTDESSPATSATATDATRSPPDEAAAAAAPGGGGRPPGGDRRRGDRHPGSPPPGDADAARRLRRHRRLVRVRRAAEAREAAVREVRGTDQRGVGKGGRRCRDAPWAFAFACQFLLVSMSALAFAPGALRDKVYGPLDPGGGGEDGTSTMSGGGGTKGGSTTGDRNPFAGLQTDDVIILDGGGATGGKKSRGGGHGADRTFDYEDAGISRIDYVNVIQLVCIASGYACLCSLLALGFMMMLSSNLIHSTLIFTIAVSLIWTLLGLAYGSRYVVIPVSGAVSLTLSFLYTVVVWDRISFAATNLSVALKGMRETLVIIFVGLCVLAMTFLWTIWWMCAFIGTFNFLNDDEGLSNDWMSVVVAFYFFSYYWTFQVIKGISQTTVASIIGKWWDMSEDEALPLCSGVLDTTIILNVFSSFGSICLASLIVDPCVLLTRIATFSRLARWKVSTARISNSSNDKGDEDGNLAKEPFSPHSDNVLSRNVNQWSYAYIGLYGYKFWESGSKASQLFEARGWTQVVSDDLIMTAMGMSSIIIGGSTAFMGLIVEEVDGYDFTSIHKPTETAFLVCLFVGFFLSSAFLSIIEGCVSAILVCYAVAPVEFHANHHKLSEEMKMVWKYFWLQKPR